MRALLRICRALCGCRALLPVGLFCGYTWLFCGYVRLFCGCVGLFCRYLGLFFRYAGLFGGYAGLFCGYVGLFWGYVGLFCGYVVLDPVEQQLSWRSLLWIYRALLRVCRVLLWTHAPSPHGRCRSARPSVAEACCGSVPGTVRCIDVTRATGKCARTLPPNSAPPLSPAEHPSPKHWGTTTL